MKLMSISFSLFLIVFTCLQTAEADVPRPEKCPNESSIQSVGIEIVAKDPTGALWKWISGVLFNRYDTEQDWSFKLFRIGHLDKVENNESEARLNAAESLKMLHLQGGPYYLKDSDVWGCLYNTSTMDHMAVAVTPPSFYK